MIKLFYGQPINENTSKINQKVSEYMQGRASQKLCYIAPTYQMISDLKDKVFKESKLNAVGETNFLLFKGLVNEVLKDSSSFQPIITDIQKELILKKVTNKLIDKNEITYFKKIAQYPGFYEDLLHLIKEISLENEIKEDNFLENVENQKFQELFKIYNHYYDYLKREGLNDELRQYQAAIDYLKQSELIKNTELFIIDGFQYLNLYQKKLLNKLAEQGKEVWLNLNFEETRSGIYNNYSQITADLNIEKEIKVNSLSLENEILTQIRNNLFSIDYDKISADNSLQITAAEDEETEIRHIARKIKKMITDKDIAPEQIGLIVKSQVKYFALIEELFGEYKIPYYTSNLKTFKQSGLWILINQLFDLVRNNYDRSSVFKILKSNFTDCSIEKNEMNKLQLKIWDEGIIRGKDLSYILDEKNKEYPAQLKEVINRLIDFYNQIRRAERFQDYSHNLLDILKSFQLVDNILEFADEDLIVDELRAFQILKDRLNEYDEIINQKMDFEEFVYWFKKIFKEQMIGSTSKDNLSRVQVLTPSQARNKSFDYIFIPGLLEGEFPAVNYNKWLVKDKERRILENMGINLKTKNDLLVTESYLFYKNLLNTGREINLTYPTLGEGEGGAIISSFVEEVKNLFIEESIEINEVHNYDFIIDEKDKAFSLSELKDYTLRRISAQKLKELISGFDVESLRNSGQYTKADGLIDDPEILNTLKDHFHQNYSYSASSLETYVQCPFKFFIEKVLRLEEKQEPEDRLDALQLGDLYHRILFKYFSSHFPGDWSNALESYIKELENAAERVFADYEGKRSLPQGVWQVYREEILNNLRLLIEAEYNNEYQTTPLKLEFGFGISEDYQDSPDNIKEPVDIKLTDETIKLKGKIDRIDSRRSQEDIMVYDYKYSDKRGKTSDFFDYKELQIPLYILAIKNLMPDKKLMGGAYYSVKKLSKNGIWQKEFVDYAAKTNRSPTVMSEEKWEDYFAGLKEELAKILAGIRRGDYRLEPEECEYCDGKEICRYNKSRVGDFID